MNKKRSIQAGIRDILDFPKPGIIFKDITPILGDPTLFRYSIELFSDRYRDKNLDVIAAIDARGFLFGAALAYELGVSLVPVRKKGKLPYKSISISYSLEYGTSELEVHEDALIKGQQVLIIDDLLATGGTAKATADLIQKIGGEVVEAAFLVELSALEGRQKLDGIPVYSPISY